MIQQPAELLLTVITPNLLCKVPISPYLHHRFVLTPAWITHQEIRLVKNPRDYSNHINDLHKIETDELFELSSSWEKQEPPKWFYCGREEVPLKGTISSVLHLYHSVVVCIEKKLFSSILFTMAEGRNIYLVSEVMKNSFSRQSQESQKKDLRLGFIFK